MPNTKLELDSCDMDLLYYNLLPLTSLTPSENYKCVGKQYKTNKCAAKEFLPPVTVFENGVDLEADKGSRFVVSLGIFNLDTSSVTATILKDNQTTNQNLELSWTERAGKGRFTSKIPSYLVATSSPVLSYEGGVLNVSVPVKSRSENEAVFVGRLESKS